MSKGSDKYAEEINNLNLKMEKITKENMEINSKIDELITSTKFMSDMYDQNVGCMKEIKTELLEIKNQNKLLLEKNALLKKEIQIEKKGKA